MTPNIAAQKDNTINRLLEMPISSRLDKLGVTNLRLLRKIKRCGGITHKELVGFVDFHVDTQEELFYRILFMEAIGIVEEERTASSTRYVVASEVADRL